MWQSETGQYAVLDSRNIRFHSLKSGPTEVLVLVLQRSGERFGASVRHGMAYGNELGDCVWMCDDGV